MVELSGGQGSLGTSIGSSEIETDAVTTTKIKDANVTVAKLEDNACFIKVAETVLGSANALISVTIPAGYRKLMVLPNFTSTASATVSFQFNTDTGANYLWQSLKAVSTTLTGLQNASSVSLRFTETASGSYNTDGFITVTNEASLRKSVTFLAGRYNINFSLTGVWDNSTDEISSVEFKNETSTFKTGSKVTVYGLKGT